MKKDAINVDMTVNFLTTEWDASFIIYDLNNLGKAIAEALNSRPANIKKRKVTSLAISVVP